MQPGSGAGRVVGLDRALADALADAVERESSLQLVTPADARLTLAARLAVVDSAARWVVVAADGGYYDGLSGMCLRSAAEGFEAVLPEEPEPAEDLDHLLAAQYTAIDAPRGRQVWVGVELRHGAAPTGYGTIAETVCRHLTGASPASWGPVEPATQPWDPDALHEFVAARAPDPTRLVLADATGGVAGTLEILGPVETLVLAVASPSGELPPRRALVTLADAVRAAHPLWTMTVLARPGRDDLTYPARREGPVQPLGLAVGPAHLAGAGPDHALLLADPPGHRLGTRERPAVWYAIASPDPWDALARVLEHLDTSPGNPVRHSQSGRTEPGAAGHDGVGRLIVP
jgi:hypothetical protein